jgi:hypothetical protein
MKAAEAYLSTTTQGGGQGRFFLACGSACSSARKTFGPLCPVVPSISFLRLFVLTGLAARDVDHAFGELGGIAEALAVAYHAVIVPPREDLCTVRLEMGHIGLRP